MLVDLVVMILDASSPGTVEVEELMTVESITYFWYRRYLVKLKMVFQQQMP